MVSNGSGSWYNVPPRPFPALVWLEQRYPFRVSPSALAWQGAHPAARGRRPFPAQAWLAWQKTGR